MHRSNLTQIIIEFILLVNLYFNQLLFLFSKKMFNLLMFAVNLCNNSIEGSVKTLMDISKCLLNYLQFRVLNFHKFIVIIHAPVCYFNQLIKLFWVILTAIPTLNCFSFHWLCTYNSLVRTWFTLFELCVYALLMQIYHFRWWAGLNWWRSGYHI